MRNFGEKRKFIWGGGFDLFMNPLCIRYPTYFQPLLDLISSNYYFKIIHLQIRENRFRNPNFVEKILKYVILTNHSVPEILSFLIMRRLAVVGGSGGCL